MVFQENNKPIYLQIADKICDDIMAGVYQPGGRIPSVREYAATVMVNVNTVMRAFDYLTDHDVIQNRRGIGFFATPVACEAVKTLRKETFYNDELKYFFSRLRSMGVTSDELLRLYEETDPETSASNH